MEGINITKIRESLIGAYRRKLLIDKTVFAAMLFSGTFISFFVFFIFDYLTEFPWIIRLCISLGIITCFAFYLPWKKKNELEKKKEILEIAKEVESRALEEQKKGFNSMLVSAVEFAQFPNILGSAELKERTVSEACSPQYNPEKLRLYNTKNLSLAKKIALTFIFVYISWAAMGLDSMKIFFIRALGLSFNYPTKTVIKRIIYPEISAQYKNITIVIEAEGVIPSKGKLAITYEGESSFSLPLEAGSLKNSFVSVVKEPAKSLSFYVRLGDTESSKHKIKVVRQPYVKDGYIEVIPPQYTGQEKKIFGIGNCEVLENSRFDVVISPDREIQEAFLHIGDKEYQLSETIGKYALKNILIENVSQYSVKLVDKDNIENTDRLSYSISVIKDQLPTVKLEKPNHGNFYAPVSKMSWTLKASDDFGMSDILLHYVVTQKNELNQDIKISENDIKLADLHNERETTLSGFINLLDLKLKPGMSVSFQSLIKDNCSFRKEGELGRSGVNTVNIVSAAELRAIIEEEMLNLNKMVNDVKSDMKHQVKMINLEMQKESKQ